MLIASQLKKTNISEYLLYMWQVEDLIRALQFDMDRINNTIISRFQFQDDTERKTVVEWYESLIEMMRMEQVMEKGHLQINKNVISELDELHALLLRSGQVPAFMVLLTKNYHAWKNGELDLQ
jgi:hypothetical protein